MRQQIESPLIDGFEAPKPLVDMLARVEAQTRAIDYLMLPLSAAGDIPAPAEDALKSYFEERKAEYRAPEYRALDILLVDPTTLANPADVSDDDAKADYDKLRDTRFTTPERRKLQQIVFPDQASADEAEAKIKAGANFDDIVKARNLTLGDVDLGETTMAAMFDKTTADAAFALPDGGVSEVIKGQFGPAIVRVAGVTPGVVKSFDEVEDTLKKEISADRVAGQVQTIRSRTLGFRARPSSRRPSPSASKRARFLRSTRRAATTRALRSTCPTRPNCSPPPMPPTSASTTRRCRPPIAAGCGST
jgi:peptidyl-prolyl cis-trans isomerase D